MNRPALAACAALALAACSGKPAEKNAAVPAAAPAAVGPTVENHASAGRYIMDPAHTSVNFRVSHMGLSHYTARFTKMDGALDFDPANPAAQKVSVTIDPSSIQTNYPLKDVDFDGELRGKQFFDVAQFPTM